MARGLKKLLGAFGIGSLQPDNDATLSASVGGEATALGDSVLAQGEISLKVIDKGPVTIIKGKASLLAMATGDDAIAEAYGYGETSGADFLMTRTRNTYQSGEDGAATKARFVMLAIEFDRFDFAQPIEMHGVVERQQPLDGPLPITGSVAEIEVETTAMGDSTFTDALADATSLEGFGSAAGDAYAIIA